MAAVIPIGLGVLRIDHVTKYTDAFHREGFCQIPDASKHIKASGLRDVKHIDNRINDT